MLAGFLRRHNSAPTLGQVSGERPTRGPIPPGIIVGFRKKIKKIQEITLIVVSKFK
jgi:hypothetical protein